MIPQIGLYIIVMLNLVLVGETVLRDDIKAKIKNQVRIELESILEDRIRVSICESLCQVLYLLNLPT